MSLSIKNVALFGATGMTGLATLPLAVAAGYNVTVLVRDPARLPADHKASRVVVGDVLNKEAVKNTMEGQDAVIIVLGTRSDLSPTTMMSEGTKNILDAMKARGIRKVIGCMSAFLLWDRSKVPPRLLPVTEDHDRMYMALKESGLDYVAVMPPHIDDKLPLTENYTETENMLKGRVISKHDLGHFFVKCLSVSDWDRKTVGKKSRIATLKPRAGTTQAGHLSFDWSGRMISKGQKRKLQDDDFSGGIHTGICEIQCRSLLDISLNKYYSGQDQVEPSLRRSVLIANTLKQIQPDNRPLHGLVNLTGPVQAIVPLLPSAKLESPPDVVMSGAFSVDDLEDEWMSSESDFSVSAAVGSILKDLDVSIDGGPQASCRTPFMSIDNIPGALGLKQGPRGHLSSGWCSVGCRTSERVALGGVAEVDVNYSYVSDGTLGDLLHDIDTSILEREMGTLGVRANSGTVSDGLKHATSLTSVPSGSPPSYLSQGSRDLNELEHVMEILVTS
ncbi:hypothetical protein DPEC_G00299220 [Dallia pectoralis]|uniref:Uncharacterized protein n=1 Tax=Dallia pectoralis TaxID=75939 RepID=A0ACC2FG84_DALPE|nr:hypothetical protein DPEC_G00299220 [Dallia pectoralis]